MNRIEKGIEKLKRSFIEPPVSAEFLIEELQTSYQYLEDISKIAAPKHPVSMILMYISS